MAPIRTMKRIAVIVSVAAVGVILAVAIYFGLQRLNGPAPAVPETAISIEGPDQVRIGRYAQLWIKGTTVEELARSRLHHWPQDGTQIIPAMTWAGEPFLLVTSDQPGAYWIGVCTPSDDGGIAGADHELTIVGEPEPKPDPEPDPEPEPSPDPTPGPGPGPHKLWLILVEETLGQRSPAVASYLADPRPWEFLRAGGHHWRLVDQDCRDEQGNASAAVAPYVEQAKAVGLPYLILVAVDDDDPKFGHVVEARAPPATVDELLDLLRKWGDGA